ncbi:MAG: hypothetical protein ABIR80_00495, partial [Opitutaceae bacterium]
IASSMAEHLLIREAVMSGLENWELQFLHVLLADPRWNEQRPGRSALLQALASAIVKERQSEKIEALLLLAANQRTTEAWRRRSLLEGIAANARVRPACLIAFDHAPAALDSLGKSDEPPPRLQIEAISSLFSWPGHQSDAAAAKPAAASTLTAPMWR